MKVKKYDSVEVGKIYSSNNCGDFEVLEKLPRSKIKVRFLKTGTEKIFEKSKTLIGAIKDFNFPRYFNVGYMGEGKYRGSKDKYKNKEYLLWKNILSRCYNPSGDYYYLYGGKGVTVDKRWHNFQNFCEDIQHLENYDKWKNKQNNYDYTIDKDKYSKDCKIYSKDTCWFTSMMEQNLLQNKVKIIGYVNGEKKLEFSNIKHIEDAMGISSSAICASLSKRRKSIGRLDGMPIVWRYEDDTEDILYKKHETLVNGYVNNELIFKNLNVEEARIASNLKYSDGIYGCIKNKNKYSGKLNGIPIVWKYAEE